MRVKVCGITRLEDARLAADAGAWAVGFIFVPDTPRYITSESVGRVVSKLPESLEKVGVFADSPINEVIKITKQAGITKIQLHGTESPEYCTDIAEATGKEVIKAFRVKQQSYIELIERYREKISYILLDTFSEKHLGGTGETFDWNIAKQAKRLNIPLIIAGGLNPENIMAAYSELEPYALDLSSGLEKAKGIKDEKKLKELKKIINLKRATP